MEWFINIIKNFIGGLKWFAIANLLIIFIIILIIIYGAGIKAFCVNLPKSIQSDEFPIMPLMSYDVMEEIKEVCSNNKCPNLDNWLYKIQIFRGEYQIFQTHNKIEFRK